MNIRLIIGILIALTLGGSIAYGLIKWTADDPESTLPVPAQPTQNTPGSSSGSGAVPGGGGVVAVPNQSDIPFGKMGVRGKNSTIVVNDFRTERTPFQGSEGNFFEVAKVDDSSGINRYTILYFEADESFAVIIGTTPLGIVRREAERKLLSDLGISQSEACALTYYVSTPYFVSPGYSGKNLLLSFCPGAEVLPEV